MQSKSESANQPGSDPHIIQQYALHSEPWWRNMPYNGSPAMAMGNASNLSSSEGPNGSLSNGRMNEEDDDASKESQTTASSRCVDHGNVPHVASSMTTVHDECLTQPPQLELVGHSIACTTNPYQDPYYGEMMAAYGHQPLASPHLIGMHQIRMPLPHEMAQEPVYVNAKQFQGILRRRQARAKAELEKKLIKVRKPYLHESRHQHAMRRARGTGGRFARKTGADSSKSATEGKAIDSGLAIATQGEQETRVPPLHISSEASNYGSGGGRYLNHSDLQTSTHLCHNGSKGEGDCSDQQRGSISSNKTSRRPLSIM